MIEQLRVSSGSQRVRIVAEPRSGYEVSGDATVDAADGRVTVEALHSRTLVRVPEGTDVVLGTSSASVTVEGRVGTFAVSTSSGAVDVDHAATLDARTRSGRVRIGRVDGTCRIRTRSGRVEVDACGPADVSTTSGRVVLRSVDGPVQVNCVSGAVEVQLAAAHDVEVTTVSGRADIRHPPGVSVRRDGDPPLEDPAADSLRVTVRSVSGRVRIAER